MKAIRVHKPGGPDALIYEDVPDPIGGPEHAVVRVEAVGMNFAELRERRNADTASGPVGIGTEAAGTIVQVGADVSGFKPGDRVAFNAVPGAYAELVSVPAGRLIPIPDGVTTRQAAATLLQGMTAHYLACSTYPLGANDTCLVHAAAGGVGLLLCQMAKIRGARVLGTVSTREKAESALQAGADEAILYSQVDFVDSVNDLTDGQGVNVIYDSVGKATFLKGFDCIRPFGMMVLYGQASGPVDLFDVSILQRRSVSLARVGLGAYTASREDLLHRAQEVFGWVGDGNLKVHIHAEYALQDAPRAQEALENRATIGKVLLIPR